MSRSSLIVLWGATSLLSIGVTSVTTPTAVAAETVAEESVVAEGAKVEKLAGGMKFTEGPVWVPEKNVVVFSDIPNSKLMQWHAKEGLSEFRESENANGNVLDRQGRIISCQHSGRNVIRINTDGTSTVLVDKFQGKRFNSPNDVAVHTDGTLWFTDPPWGLWGSGAEAEIPGHWVYKFDPKSGEIEAVIKDLAMPNGIVFSPDHRRIYVADTGGHPKHPDAKLRELPGSIRCYELNAQGRLGKVLFTIDQGSDGMAVDVQGNVYTTHGGKVHVYDADGRKIQAIDVPEGPANCCFGGDDFKTLFITARTSLYSVRVKYAGAK